MAVLARAAAAALIARTLAALLVLLLVACAPVSSGSAPETAGPLAPSTEPAAETKAEPDQSAGAVDYSCSSDAQCTVKNVGNCCGYSPACVNVDSPTFPEQVQADCAANGLSGICGFKEISACQCVDQRCEAKPAASAIMGQD